MKQKKGQLFMLGIMLFIIAIVVITITLEPLKEQLAIARTGLDCTNTSIGTGNKMACIVVDFTLFAYVGVGVAVAIGYLAIKRIIGGEEGQ